MGGDGVGLVCLCVCIGPQDSTAEKYGYAGEAAVLLLPHHHRSVTIIGQSSVYIASRSVLAFCFVECCDVHQKLGTSTWLHEHVFTRHLLSVNEMYVAYL